MKPAAVALLILAAFVAALAYNDPTVLDQAQRAAAELWEQVTR